MSIQHVLHRYRLHGSCGGSTHTNRDIVFVVAPAGTVKVYKYKNDSSGTFWRKTASGTTSATRVELTVPTDLIRGGAASNKFYDHRRAQGVSVLDIDVGELKTLIEDGSAAAPWTKDANSFNPATEWTGIVPSNKSGNSCRRAHA